MFAEQSILNSGDRTERLSLFRVVGFYLLSACLHGVLVVISMLPVVNVWFARLGWLLNEWRSFPSPYDFEAWAATPLGSTFGPLFVPLSLASVLALFLVVVALHTASFAVVVFAHALFGWPKYWKDIRARLNLKHVWARSVRRSWWVWPVTQFVWLLLAQIGSGYLYAFYPIIDSGPPFFVANLVAACLTFGLIADRLLRSSVIEAVGDDERRCWGCEYLLRGLADERCPECGARSDRDGDGGYGVRLFKRQQPLRRVSRRLAIALIVALLLAPVWLPLGLVNLPRTWRRHIPEAIRPNWQVSNRDPNSFPIRLDTVCVIRHDDAVAVVRFEQVIPDLARWRADYRLGFWIDRRDMESGKQPDSTSTDQVLHRGGPNLPIGPWKFTYIMTGNMIWLSRPDPTYEIAAFTESDLPDKLRSIVTVLENSDASENVSRPHPQ